MSPNEIQTFEILRADGGGYAAPSAVHVPAPWWERDPMCGGWPRLTDAGWDARVRAGGAPRNQADVDRIDAANKEVFALIADLPDYETMCREIAARND
jgi:hypothetical protein